MKYEKEYLEIIEFAEELILAKNIPITKPRHFIIRKEKQTLVYSITKQEEFVSILEPIFFGGMIAIQRTIKSIVEELKNEKDT